MKDRRTGFSWVDGDVTHMIRFDRIVGTWWERSANTVIITLIDGKEVSLSGEVDASRFSKEFNAWKFNL
jgi:hypothetical protein